MIEPRRPAVDPQLLYGFSLIIGLIVTWPSLNSAMHGNSDIVAAGIRLLVTIALSWTGCFLVSNLIGGYSREIDIRERQRVEAETSIERRSETQVSGTNIGVPSGTNLLGFDAPNQLPQPTSNESEPAPYSSTTTS